MACNCITEIETKFLENYKSLAEEKGWQIEPKQYSEGLQNVAILLNRNNGTIQPSSSQLHTQYNFSYTFEKKDKTRSKPKREKVNVMFNNCPFCGASYNNNSEEKEEQK